MTNINQKSKKSMNRNSILCHALLEQLSIFPAFAFYVSDSKADKKTHKK